MGLRATWQALGLVRFNNEATKPALLHHGVASSHIFPSKGVKEFR
jgi:hypothetical protein